VRDSWNKSIATVKSNRKAVLTRGLRPKAFNYNVLHHKENIGIKQSEVSSNLTSTIDCTELNLNTGPSWNIG
jgi:hypothetical protein